MPATVTAAAPASPGILFATIDGDFDFHWPPEQLLAVQLFYRPQGVLLRFHGYKTESTGISRRAVRNENGLQNGSGVGKKITHILLGSRVVQIPYVEFILHLSPVSIASPHFALGLNSPVPVYGLVDLSSILGNFLLTVDV